MRESGIHGKNFKPVYGTHYVLEEQELKQSYFSLTDTNESQRKKATTKISKHDDSDGDYGIPEKKRKQKKLKYSSSK